jgi:hypothetical protein
MKKADNFDAGKWLIENKITKQSNSRMSLMKWIRDLTPQIKQAIEDLKLKYPEHKFDITSNDKWRPDDKKLAGTYTLSVSGPSDDELSSEIDNI